MSLQQLNRLVKRRFFWFNSNYNFNDKLVLLSLQIQFNDS